MAKPEIETFVNDVDYAIKLKTIPRTGWIIMGVPNPEHVADHTYGARQVFKNIADLLEQDLGHPINRELIGDMIDGHDAAEASVGDIVVHRGLNVNLRLKRSRDAAERVALINRFGRNHRITLLHDEFTRGETEEAKIAKASEILDMVFTAFRYEVDAGRKYLDDFYRGHEEAFSIAPPFQEALQEILDRRQNIETRVGSGRRSFSLVQLMRSLRSRFLQRQMQ